MRSSLRLEVVGTIISILATVCKTHSLRSHFLDDTIMENSCTQNKATCYELFPLELPTFGTAPSLEAELRKGAKERLASRKIVAQQKRSEKCRDVPSVYKLVYPSPPKIPKCQHSGNFILDRDVLNPADYIDFIARPKEVIRRKKPHYVKHKLSSATNRIKTLARPGTTHVKATLERYSTQLSPKQKQHLQSMLEPKPFVTIMESIGYAKQQRSDEAMWQRHMAKQEQKLLHKIHRWENELLKIAMNRLAKQLRDYYLTPSEPPLTEEAVRISRVILHYICHFLDIPILHIDEQGKVKDNDVIDDFYVELSKKIGYWVWTMMKQIGITFDKQKSFSYVRKSESFVSVNSSVFQLDFPTTDEEGVASKLEPLSILSLEVIYDCLDEAVLTVEKGINGRRSSVCMESDETSQSNENKDESKTDTSNDNISDASMHDNMQSADQTTDQTIDEIEEHQVRVIENIQNEETDENERKEEKPQQT
ncbi:LOW QUALITY PROTEIN: uncharacterized protein LOC128712268 [Anopheles marshallii]|uniref:LOW QUALITY PROTEIN: uncharacterized protein LOC128712268 n=1 Tax=Anopheles marshallii TaxID=1521116 RepID=UPI00237B64F4|nr:LOW QUALITY PROTEIN: uncharacterized protein LOC128712268 [Anopheles marshallii]